MLRTLFIFPFLFSLISLQTQAQSKANITYIDSSGTEKKADWKTKTFIIEKSQKDFRYKKAQTWVALPPLLKLKSKNPKFKTIPNDEELGSPFFSDKNIKSVLRFEHFESSIVFPMHKRNVKGESTVRIKIDGLLDASVVSVSEDCEKQGIRVNSSETAKTFISIDCKPVTSGLKIAIWSSENLTQKIPSHSKVEVETSRPSSMVLSLDQEDLKNNSAIEIIDVGSSENSNIVVYNRPQQILASVPTNHKKQSLAGTLPKTPLVKTENNRSSLTLANATIYASKLGAEAFLSVNYKPDHSSGYLTFYALTPLRYFQQSQTDNFFELGASYNRRLGLSPSLPLTLGIGFKGIKWNDLNSKQLTLTGPEIIARLIDLQLFSRFLHYSMSARYTPTFLRSDFRGSRMLWEFANFRVYQSPEFDISLSTQYSFLEVKTDDFRYTDSKFMGGASLQW